MNSKYPQNSFIVDAIYNENVQSIFKGNPAIEALDIAMSAGDVK